MDFQFPGILSLHDASGIYQQNPVGPDQWLVGGAKRVAATSSVLDVSGTPPLMPLNHRSLMLSRYLALAWSSS